MLNMPKFASVFPGYSRCPKSKTFYCPYAMMPSHYPPPHTKAISDNELTEGMIAHWHVKIIGFRVTALFSNSKLIFQVFPGGEPSALHSDVFDDVEVGPYWLLLCDNRLILRGDGGDDSRHDCCGGFMSKFGSIWTQRSMPNIHSLCIVRFSIDTARERNIAAHSHSLPPSRACICMQAMKSDL